MNANFEDQKLMTAHHAVAASVSAPPEAPAAVTTDWTFGGLWPFEPRWFVTPDGLLHYVDEGQRDGRPVVLVHGNLDLGIFVPELHRPAGESGPPRDRALTILASAAPTSRPIQSCTGSPAMSRAWMRCWSRSTCATQ